MAEELARGKPPSPLATIATMIQMLSVVLGVAISVASFFSAQEKEAESRKAEAEARKVEADLRRRELDRLEREQRQKTAQAAQEAVRPFLQLRQERYVEIARVAGVLGSEGHDPQAVTLATKRFNELYFAELTLVEDQEVESAMVKFAKALNDQTTSKSARQNATVHLAQALRSSLLKSWRLEFDTGESKGISPAPGDSASGTSTPKP